MRARLLAVLACALAACWCAPAASGFDVEEAREVADRAALAWSAGQQADGALVDPVSKRPTGGYANAMVGYALLRAGARRGDPAVVARGVRAVDASLGRPPGERGVFDALAVATAYDFARRELADDAAFVRSRGRWEEYLRTLAEPKVSDKVAACDADPQCFHNHEVVEALGDLALARTGLRPDSAERRAAAVGHLAVEVPAGQGDLGLLSDTGSWPLAYHGLSSGMLAGAVSLLGDAAPAPARRALMRAVDTSAALMAPDGDVAYLGRRQQQGWALAGTMWAAAVAVRAGRGTPEAARATPHAERAQGVADRAFDRLTRLHRTGPGGLGAVPRELDSYRGVDANGLTSVALVLFMLNLAADEQEAAGEAEPKRRDTDEDSTFVDSRRTGLAVVRRGDLWYAAHRRPSGGGRDRRYDFGVVALKQRTEDGAWRDLVRPRPLTRGPSADSAGPVIVADGQRWLPWGTRIEARPDGSVRVTGGWRSQQGAWLRRGVTFRFVPTETGVALTFPLEAGDSARLTTYLPRQEARETPTTVRDDRSAATLQPAPADIRLTPGYASCCDADLTAATMTVRPTSDTEVTYTVAARQERSAARARAAKANANDGTDRTVATIAVLAILAAAWVVVARARRRGRRRARRRRRHR